jgi:threonine synthase
MRYVSTRGQSPALSFEEVMLAGLARDGGLYLPESWPRLAPVEIADLAGLGYEEAAFRVMRPFIGGCFSDQEFRQLIDMAYGSFDHPARCPLVQIGSNEWILELHHGPTFAFKDVALQLVGRMFGAVLARSGGRVTIVGATSGDTGSAAMEAFRGADNVDVFFLHPAGRVSEVQRRQMTTLAEPNVHAIALEGDFDDCQARVKDLFADAAFRDQVGLAAANSINWARVMAQIVYYFTSAVALGTPARRIGFSVPTGNFGDIYAGHVARHMGLAVGRLVIATNENDILHRTVQSGDYRRQAAHATLAPSMDIQVSSNFERLLWELYDGDAGAVAQLMGELSRNKGFTLSQGALERLREGFVSARIDRAEVLATIRRLAGQGMVIDPHTAIGVAAARACRGDPAIPMVVLGTAHAAKFPDAVEEACGIRPALPARLADLGARPERMTTLPNDVEALKAHIRKART